MTKMGFTGTRSSLVIEVVRPRDEICTHRGCMFAAAVVVVITRPGESCEACGESPATVEARCIEHATAEHLAADLMS